MKKFMIFFTPIVHTSVMAVAPLSSNTALTFINLKAWMNFKDIVKTKLKNSMIKNKGQKVTQNLIKIKNLINLKNKNNNNPRVALVKEFVGCFLLF